LHRSSDASATHDRKSLGRRWGLGILLVAFLLVLLPFLFWHSTWFGRPLTGEQISKDLADLEHPRATQHALSQIADRVLSRDPSVRASARQWYPQVAALAAHRSDEIRLTAAWVMGQDTSVPEFHEALRKLVADPNPMVRRNAALSLVRFGDPSGKPQILAMLKPYAIQAPQGGGKLSQRLKAGEAVNPGTLLGRIKTSDGETEIRSPVPGVLERWLAADGSGVKPGDPVALVSPSPEMAWEALRALFLIGTAEDLPEVERYASGVAGMPDQVRQQAALTARAIRARAREEPRREKMNALHIQGLTQRAQSHRGHGEI